MTEPATPSDDVDLPLQGPNAAPRPLTGVRSDEAPAASELALATSEPADDSALLGRGSRLHVLGSVRPRRPVVLAFLLVTALGVALLALGVAGVVPQWFEQVGSVVVTGGFCAALANRLGLPLWLSVGVGVVLSAAAVLLGRFAAADFLLAGAAVLMTALTSVVAVLHTVPAVRLTQAIREVVIAYLIAMVGGLAVVGFGSTVNLAAFELVAMTCAVIAMAIPVSHLGRSVHTAPRRNLVLLVAGALVLLAALLYLELFRRYAAPGAVTSVEDAVGGVRGAIGAVPKPVQVLVGIPALMFGVHLRARRRLGWWACCFGAVATGSVAMGLMNPMASFQEAGLSLVYSLLLGLLLGALLVAADRAINRPRGRRGRRDESLTRPEPGRLEPLL